MLFLVNFGLLPVENEVIGVDAYKRARFSHAKNKYLFYDEFPSKLKINILSLTRN